jgi:hypothetical protein
MPYANRIPKPSPPVPLNPVLALKAGKNQTQVKNMPAQKGIP